MSPIYEDEATTREDLEKIRRKGKCKVCGSSLALFWNMAEHQAYLACNDFNRTGHEGIEIEASPYEMRGLLELNIPKRREMMEEEYGSEKSKALEKYIGVVSLTKPQAREILKLVFPDAPDEEIARAVILCASYGLNPLMKHVFLIPFNKGKASESWATVIGIKAKRLLASRRGNYSYVDNTPRVMTKQEQEATFGEFYNDRLWVITKLKDPQTGAEAVGYGFWPRDTQPYGTEKGNTSFNMATIRSESQALDRLRPGEMPVGIEVMPEEAAEAAIETTYRIIEEEPKSESVPEPKEHWCPIHNVAFQEFKRNKAVWYAHKLPDGNWCNEQKAKNSAKHEIVETQSQDSRKNELLNLPINNLGDLFNACIHHFKLNQSEVLKELGGISKENIADAHDAWLTICASRL